MSTPISGHKAQLDVSGAAVAMTTEDFTVIAGTGNASWRITDATKQIFDWRDTFVVEADDGGWNTLGVDEYDIKFLTGTVEINNYTSGSANVANITDVRITGDYLPMYEAVEAESASVELLSAMLMVSVLGNDGERRIQGRLDGSVDYSDLRTPWVPVDSPTDAENAIIQYLLDGNPAVVSIYPNRDNTAYAIRMAVNAQGVALQLPGGDKFTNQVSLVGSTQTAAMSSQELLIWELLE